MSRFFDDQPWRFQIAGAVPCKERSVRIQGRFGHKAVALFIRNRPNVRSVTQHSIDLAAKLFTIFITMTNWGLVRVGGS